MKKINNIRNKLELKRDSGITLVSLVVTVIVLAILAGITIASVFSENGLLSQSKDVERQAKNKNDKTESAINKLIEDYEKAMQKPESTVQMPEGVPLPDGFYYVGGEKEDGIVISDNPEDEGKGTSDEVADTLKGNQFVWIPVEDFSKFSYIKGYTVNPNNTINISTWSEDREYLNDKNSINEVIERLENYSGKSIEGMLMSSIDDGMFYKLFYSESGRNDSYISRMSTYIYYVMVNKYGVPPLDEQLYFEMNIFDEMMAKWVNIKSLLQETEYQEIFTMGESEYKNLVESMIADGILQSSSMSYLDATMETLLAERSIEYMSDEKQAVYESVSKNKGFYIGRYEASYATGDGTIIDGSVKPIEQKNKKVWFIWNEPTEYMENEPSVKAIANAMYKESDGYGVISTGIYGAEWNAILEFLSSEKNPNNGKLYIDDATGMANYEEPPSGSGYKEFYKTGEYQVKHIYDIAGNALESTMLKSPIDFGMGGEGWFNAVMNGGGVGGVGISMLKESILDSVYGKGPGYGGVARTSGFRVALYVK